MANRDKASEVPALRVVALSKTYTRRERLGLRRRSVLAADAVSFDIPRGKTLALIGSSGSGKSTVARCISRLETPDEGQIWIGDTNIAPLRPRDLRPFRSRMQMIFQDAATAINPRFSAEEVIGEPLLFQEHVDHKQRLENVRQLMKEVGLRPEWGTRRAHDFSGGQKQRLAIARALAVKPEILILDEALSGLDLSTQAQVVNLLLEVQESRSLACLLISHDLKLVVHLADAIATMSEGRILEQGTAAQMLARPETDEMRRLIAASETTNMSRGVGAGGSV
jgi:ABC-type glutathione transport system ATPase component